MAKVHKGRFTAEVDGDVVVFVIGMRFNKLWKVHKWMPVFVAMPKMLRVLLSDPSKGLLGAHHAGRPHDHRAPVLAQLRRPGALRP